jgi:hypothetical protein
MRRLSLRALLAPCAGTIMLSGTALGYQTVMIRDSGPAINRVNLVVLGDGYLESELPQLEADVRAAFGAIDQEPFYAQYANFINVKLVLTSSTSNVLGNGAPGATLFGLYFGCQGIDRLICIGDESQVVTVLDQDAPDWDLVAIIANSAQYGGSGGQFVTFTRDTDSTRILIHETAHQFATLADEYPDAYPAYPSCGAECPEPNVTRIASPWQSLKWNYWVNQATLLPTPDTTEYASVIGAFQGARYQSTGIFRPRHTCRMREVDQTFCEICAEAHVLETYRLVGDFDTSSPSSSKVSLSSGASQNLSVTHPQTSTNSVHYAWTIDGSVVNGTNPSLDVSASSLTPGDHTVSVRLSDTTNFAGRDDPLLHKQRSWTVTVTAAGSTGGSSNATGGTAAVTSGGTNATTGGTSAAFGGASAISTGGTRSAVGGTSATAMGGTTAIAIGGTSSAMGGSSTAAVGTTAIPVGGTGSTIGGSSTTTGGTMTVATLAGGTIGLTTGAAGTTTSGTTQIATGGAAISTGGAAAPNATDASTNPDGTVRTSCSCSVPGRSIDSTPALAWGSLLLALGSRLSRHRKHRSIGA